MPRHDQIVRQWTLLQELKASPRTVPELASRLHTTRRTVYRDLEVLQALPVPFPLVQARHEDGSVRWHLSRHKAPVEAA